jgi:type I restriction enzyme S subunit
MEYKTLGSLVDRKIGYGIVQPGQNILHGVPVIKVNNLIAGLHSKGELDVTTKENDEKYSRTRLEGGELIVSVVGTVGKTAIVPKSFRGCNLVRAVAMIDIKENWLSRWVKYYIDSPAGQAYIEQNLNTTVQATLNIKTLVDMPIPFLKEDEMRKIVTILEAIDKKIECNQQINDNLLEQMQALYKSWFVDYRPFGGVMPTSWTQTGIYSLANIIYGAPFASKQFNTEGNGKPIIRIRDLKDQQFATYTTEVHPKGYLLHPGDIVVGMDGEFRPYIWGNDEAWLNQRVCVFENKRPNGKAFLYFTIKPLLFAIEQTQVATTVIHIGKKDFDAFEIMLPDTELLDAFDVITTPMVEQIVSNSIENKRLAIMRDVLLPKLMSGEIDVSAIRL